MKPVGDDRLCFSSYKFMQKYELTPRLALCARFAAGASCLVDVGTDHGYLPINLLLGGKKVCGILTESAFRPDGTPDWVIVGIGVNVSQTAADFSPDVAAIATSLRMELKGDVSRDALAQALTAQLAALHDSALPCPSLWREDYCARCVNVGQRVRLTRDGAIRGAVAEGIDPQYGLTVRYDDGSEETLRGGEVSVRGLYGYSE